MQQAWKGTGGGNTSKTHCYRLGDSMKVLSNNLSLTKGLLEKLQELFPNTLPVSPITVEELRFLQGQQSVLSKLEELYNEIYEEY